MFKKLAPLAAALTVTAIIGRASDKVAPSSFRTTPGAKRLIVAATATVAAELLSALAFQKTEKKLAKQNY